VEIEETDSKALEVLTPESEHWRGLQPDPTDRLSIRRSLVRAQVEEPIKSKGYVATRNPFLFAILESGPPVDGPEVSRRVAMGENELAQRLSAANPPPGGLPHGRVRTYVRLRVCGAKVKHSPLSTRR
jgi:hypothetical protein